MSKNFYITTPIYYVNDSPHLGHAYTTIACDTIARFMRLAGHDVKFLTGTDEHGQKVDKAARAAGIEPQAFTDDVSQRFRNLVNTGDNLLDITNTDFIRTTEDRHKKAAQALWQRMCERTAPDGSPNVYKATYGGWYAVRDEAYYQESELVEKDGKKVAPTGAEVEWVEEESYFFALSKWQDKLLEFYRSHPGCILPESRHNEVVSFVSSGLKDLSISRTTFDWGVPVPGDDKHVMYVWIDALTNYLTSTGFPDMNAEEYKKYWADAQSPGPIHMVGKDIVRFHAVYWPAFLMAADIPPPKRVFAHGWWTIEGEKMSKSLGNVLSPQDMIERAGGVDQLRYYLLRAMPFGNDGDFSQSRLIDTINAELANTIGNLAQRTLSFIQKNCDGVLPEYDDKHLLKEDKELLLSGWVTEPGSHEKAVADILSGNFQKILNGILEAASLSNQYIDQQKPWIQRKENPERMKAVLYHLAENIRCIAIMLQPFCPKASENILNQLAVPQDTRQFAHLTEKHALKPGSKLPPPQPVFPKNSQDAAA